MTNQAIQILFDNKKDLYIKDILINVGLSAFSILVTYLVLSLIRGEFIPFISLLPFILVYLSIHSIYYLTKKHTFKVTFCQPENIILITQKNFLGKVFKYRIDANQDVLLTRLSDSYGQVNFDIKYGRRSIYLSSNQIGLSKKKVKKIYKDISEAIDID